MNKTLYRPKLEAGMGDTEWSPCSTNTGSLIRQTHDMILMEVDETISGATSGLTERVGALEITSSAISGSVSELSDTVSGHTEKIGELVVTSSAISGSVSSISDTVSGHTEQLGSLTIKTDSISGSVMSIEDTVSGHTEKIGQLVVTTEALSGSVSSMSDTVSTFSGDIASLSGDVSGITDDIVDIYDDIDTLNKAIGVMSGDTPSITGLIDDIKELSGTVTTHEEKIGQLIVTANAISGSVNSVSDRVTTLSNQQQTLSATTEEHTEKIGQLVVSSQAISGSVSNVEDRLTSVTDKINSVSGTVQTHTEQIGQLVVGGAAISGSVSSISDQVTQVSNGLNNTNNVVSAHTEQIGELILTSEGFATDIKELKESSVGSNIAPVNGWKNKEGEFIEPTDQMLYSASASTITSPTIYLDAGQYTVSQYNAGSNYFTIKIDDTTVTPSSAYTMTTDTYQSCTRKVQTFSATTAGNYVFTYGDNSHDSAFYRPKLEAGDHATAYTRQSVEYESLINQTSQQITLEVTEKISENDAVAQFKRTGIDITNGKVEIDAENTYINGNLELHAQDDADALTLLDDDNIERATITSQEVGPLSGQSMSTNVQTWDYNGILDYGDSTNIVLGTKTFTANSKVTSGQGYGIDRVGYMVVTYTDENNQIQPQYISNPNSCTIEIKLVNTSNSTIQYTLPATQITQTGERYWLESRTPSNNSPITITTPGTYNIVASITWSNSTQVSPYAQHTRYRIWGYMQVEATTKTLIGADGLYSTNGENNYLHFSDDGFHASDTSDEYNTVISTVGAATTNKVLDQGSLITQDKWLDNTQKYTGPAHVANFKSGGVHWNLAQNYVNMVTITRLNNLYTSSSPFVPLPSTDVIMVGNQGGDGTEVYIDMAPMEFAGHVVTIINFESPLNTTLKSSNGARFHWPNQSGSSASTGNAFGWGDTFPNWLSEYAGSSGANWTRATFIYQDIVGSSSYGSENGRWIAINIQSYKVS